MFREVVARMRGQNPSGDFVELQTDANKALKVTGGGGGSQYDRDDAAGAGDTGTMALGVRTDIPAGLVGTDGDYTPLSTNALGYLWVEGRYDSIIASAFKAEDSAAVSGDYGLLALVQRFDAGGALVDADGDYSALQVDANGALRVTGGGGGTEYNEDAAHASGCLGKVALAVRSDIPAGLTDADGDYATLITNALNYLWVEGRYESLIATNSALAATEATLASVIKAEDAAHGSGDEGIQALSVRQDVLAALADTDGDYAPLLTDVFGQLYTREMYSSTIATELEGLSHAEDSAHTSGENGLMLLGIRKDEPESLASDSLDYTPFQFDSIGNVRTSSYVTGDVAHDSVDAGNPIKIGGKAKTTQPTAVADNDRVDATFDDKGRQVMTVGQIRGLRQTAYATLTNGTETTLLAASAGSFHDLVYIMGANDSDVAVTVNIRAVTGGNVQMTLEIPANGTAGVALPVPLPQDYTGNNWTADMGDITGTNVYLSALFNKES